MDSVYSSIDFYSNLKIKYKDYLKPEIFSITMIQSEDTVWLESIEVEVLKDGLEKQTTRRIDLDFITDDENSDNSDNNYAFFNPKDSIENNVRKFIDDLSPYSIINIIDLFEAKACEKINKKYNTFGIDS